MALPAPLLLLVPVERLVRHPQGRWFFDAWEAAGIALVVLFALVDGGARSPYVMFFYVLLAHAALAYPPAGMVIAGTGNVVGFLAVGAVAGDTSPAYIVAGSMTLAAATAICAFASVNHRLVYQRTAAIARQLAVLAERDGLTGCLDHRSFHQRLGIESARAATGRPLSLLIVDVDEFELVNDTFGHPTGDDVLRVVGQTLLGLARPGDVAGRLGGDEPALLLPGTSLPDASAVADGLRRQVRARAQAWSATVSVGVATTTLPGDTAGLLAAADRAVYVAERAGRDLTGGREPAPSGGPVPPRTTRDQSARSTAPNHAGRARTPVTVRHKEHIVTKRTTRATMGVTALALCAVGILGAGPASAHDSDGRTRGGHDRAVTKHAELRELNGSGAYGKATVIVKGDEILRIKVRARGLTPDAPHAQHIHYGEEALNECPGLAQDVNRDGRLTTVEGVPAYGPVAVSLTTSGDTSPASVLEVDRFPVAERGRIDYRRSHVPFSAVAGAGKDMGTATAAEIAQAVRDGEGVVVIHGVDYDRNGTYSFSKEGASELDPSLPAEATDPAVCGLLR